MKGRSQGSSNGRGCPLRMSTIIVFAPPSGGGVEFEFACGVGKFEDYPAPTRGGFEIDLQNAI